MKRIVFLDGDIPTIMGTDEAYSSLPVTAENFQHRGRTVAFASLVRVTARAAYYKEPMTPMSYQTMNPAQR